MNPRVITLRPETDFTLTLTFSNGEVRVFDVKPYLNIGIFRELKDKRLSTRYGRFWAAFNGKTARTSAPTHCTSTVFPPRTPDR